MIKGSDYKKIYMMQSSIQNMILNSFKSNETGRTSSGELFKIRVISTGPCSTCPLGNRLVKSLLTKDDNFTQSPSCGLLMTYRKISEDKYLSPHCSCEAINRIVLFLLYDPSIEVVSNIRKKKNADRK